jgi:hypothetical protein
VTVQWWPEVAEIGDVARSRWGLDVAVLRVDGPADRPGPPGGDVTYVAEVDADVSRLPTLTPPPSWLEVVGGRPAPHPLRAPWASPGGPAATVAWARAALAELGLSCTRVVQRKSWNLSALWQLDTSAGPLWIKQVPAFFGHEAVVLRWLGSVPDLDGLAPRLLAERDGRMLLAHIPGEDRFGAPAAEVDLMLADLHRIQAYVAGRVEELLALGVPDRRSPTALALIQDVADRHGPALAPGQRSALERIVKGLPDRFARVEECGIPETLVHGDFHPGNVRSDVGSSIRQRVVIDWGDSTIGHPALDVARATETMPVADATPLLAAWCRRWRAHTPGCDPERAIELQRPVVPLVYAEWPYHASDVPDYLGRAAELAGA